eukprot:TRINITY_DN9035_c0_g1_i1.p1 TRINITY_DN9035_c0_g1~~TRINITY_DN9035_c0_g1_i1.p1  ORF type:complete len:188 (-),score=83.25 TRINITY_DN9035_c0_g1_i1:85-606(-)
MSVSGTASTASASRRAKDEAPQQLERTSSAAVGKRLQKELMTLMMSGNKDVSAFPDGDNLFSWIGTVFEGSKFKLSLKFPQNYPYAAPTVKFETPCFHPNVDEHGNICLDILKEEWSAIYNVQTILLSIQSLLGEPNNASPLNAYAAQLWDNQLEYREVLLKKNAEAFAAGSQ